MRSTETVQLYISTKSRISQATSLVFCLFSGLISSPILAQTIGGLDASVSTKTSVTVTGNTKDTITKSPEANNRIYGVLWDDETHEPVAYANIFFKGTERGIYTDFEGQFDLGYRPWPSDTIEFIYLGYESITIRLDTVQRLPLQLYFKRKVERTQGASINLGLNPAMIWVNLAQKNRNANSPSKIGTYECEVFSKTTVAINNISKNLKKTKLATEVGAYFDTISYLTGDSNKAILPVLFSEVLSNFSFQRNPKLSKEVVKASRIRGIGVTDGSFIGQMMGSTFTNYNIYDESLIVLDKGIPTPISPGAELIYDYKLVNVDKMGPRRLFQIQVTPKNRRDLALSGFMWIEDTSGAIVRLSVEITGASNLNYIEKLKFSQEYYPTPVGAYFCTKSRVMIDVGELSDQAAGMVATNVLSCKNLRFGMDFPPRFFDNRIQIASDANIQTDSFWLANAHIKQSSEEARIASKIDTLNDLPRVKSYIDLVNFLVDGYQRVGIIDFGPYFTLASWNPYEGFRVRLGFRSTPAISKKSLTTGFLAYGFNDQQYKYGIKTDILLHKIHYTKLTISHTYDTELIGITDNELYAQSLFTAFNLLGSNNITLVRQSKINLGSDIRPGLRFNLGFFHGNYNFPYVKNYRFAYHSNFPNTDPENISNKLTNAYVSFRINYEPRSYDVRTDYDRMTFHAGGPKYSLYLQQGIKNLFGSQYNYSKVQLGYSYDKTWSIMGRSIFGIDYSQVFGLLPYPLLTVYVGNQSFMYSQNAYNQMTIFEFVSDKSLQLSFEHHFNGYVINRIPLLNRFKLREVVSTKAIYGTLQEKNRLLIPTSWNDLPVTQFKTFGKTPYWELGFGIENIFKCIRIDLIWRMTYLEPNSYRNVGVKASFAMYF